MPATSEPAECDACLMAAAIRLGSRELGRTWPNPAVGALIAMPIAGALIGLTRGLTLVLQAHFFLVPLIGLIAAKQGIQALAETAFTLCRHDVSFLMKLLQAGP